MSNPLDALQKMVKSKEEEIRQQQRRQTGVLMLVHRRSRTEKRSQQLTNREERKEKQVRSCIVEILAGLCTPSDRESSLLSLFPF